MAKVYGLNGYLRGKLGNTVFAIRNGEQMSRQYNPNPMNPKSAVQTANRAKLKLLSQLGAALQPVIAIPRMGMVSPRNGFTQANYQYTAFAGETASIDLADIQLTKSSVALSGLSADRTSGTGIAVSLLESVAASNDAVVYVVLRRTDANKVAVASSLLVREAGADGKFAATLPYQDGDIAVCAYGIRYNTVAARSAFGNINVPSALGVARLFANRTLTEGDATMTETRGLFMSAAEGTGETAGVVRYSVGLTAVGDGTATGGGRYEIGTKVTLRATPKPGATFQGYYLNNISGQLLSNRAEYTFTVEGAMSIVAKFSALPKIITVSASPAAGGSVSGGGSKEVGTNCTVVATANAGYDFAGWYEGKTLVSNAASYTFLVENDLTLEARFAESTDVSYSLKTTGAVRVSSVKLNNVQVVSGQVLDFVAGEKVNVAVSGTGIETCEVYKNSDVEDNKIATLSVVSGGFSGSFNMPADASSIIVCAHGSDE